MVSTLCAVRRRGFTLIELLIVITVIAILALMVIPRLMTAADRARAATYYSNKSELQSALEQFHADCGVYPAVLDDLYKTDKATLNTTTTGYANYSSANFNGPYLKATSGITATIALPVNPYVDDTVTANQTVAKHWTYAPVVTNNSATDYTIVGFLVPPVAFQQGGGG